MRRIDLTRKNEGYLEFLSGAIFTHYNDSDNEIFFKSYDVIHEHDSYPRQTVGRGVLALEDAQRLASWIDEIL